MAYGPGLEGGVVNQPANFTVETNGETGALGECREIVPPHSFNSIKSMAMGKSLSSVGQDFNCLCSLSVDKW